METDHKPLVPLLSSKHLDNLPPRILRFRLRMMWYNYTISHVPRKLLYSADALSRSPCAGTARSSEELEEEVETYIAGVTSTLPATKQRLNQYCNTQQRDLACSRIMEYCKTGWPRKQVMEAELVPYWKVRSSLTVHDGLLLYNDRIVVPPLLREEILARVHEGRQGIEQCHMRAKMCVWWPGISKQLTETVAKCPECARDVPLQKESLLPTQLPEYPRQVIGSDLFVLKGDTYLLAVDYYSRYPR